MTVGVPRVPLLVDLDLVQDRELTLCGNLMYVREDVAQAIRLLQSKAVPLDEIITATFDLSAATEAFRASDDPE